jgi:hypothetical protein
MPFKSAAQFSQLTSSLGGVIIEHTSKFAAQHKLPPMNAAGLDQMSAKIDDFAAELLMFGCDTWPDSAATDGTELTHESIASDVDPPKTVQTSLPSLRSLPSCLACTFGTVAASLALGAAALFTIGTGDYFTIAFGVLAVALFFGPVHALTAAGTAALLHNFFLVGTPFAFEAPTKVEITMTVFFLGLALAAPWLADRAAKWRNRSGTISPNRVTALS